MKISRIKASVSWELIWKGRSFSAKKGTQIEKYLMLPDYIMFERLNRYADGMLKIVCIAPELPGALAFIKGKIEGKMHHIHCPYQCGLYNCKESHWKREPLK